MGGGKRSPDASRHVKPGDDQTPHPQFGESVGHVRRFPGVAAGRQNQDRLAGGGVDQPRKLGHVAAVEGIYARRVDNR